MTLNGTLLFHLQIRKKKKEFVSANGVDGCADVV